MCETNNVLNLIKDFEGIIGTVLGVLLGSGLTFFSQKLGRISFFIDTWEFNLYSMSDIKVTDISECHHAKYKLEADCFNSSNALKGLRNIRVIFEGDGFKHEYEPFDASTRRPTSPISTRADKMELLTLIPKQFVRISLEGRIDNKTELQDLVKYSKVYLKALNHRNKEYKWLIKTISS